MIENLNQDIFVLLEMKPHIHELEKKYKNTIVKSKLSTEHININTELIVTEKKQIKSAYCLFCCC